MKKMKYFSNYEKEEKWLREMALQGWFLTGAPLFSYSFEKGEPQDVTFRIDFRTFKNKDDFADYVQMFADSGWQHIGGTKNTGTQYFVQTGGNYNDDIFSDNRSKAGRYLRTSKMWFSLLLPYSVLFFSLLVQGTIDFTAIFHPQDLYYTPGLWQKTGFDFWRAFLFETPFALGRGFAWVLYLVIVLFFLYSTLKSVYMGRKLLYKDEKSL